jgi:PH domain
MSIVKKSFLYKRGEVNTSWKRRWFLLTSDRVLTYYKDEKPNAKALGRVDQLDDYVLGVCGSREFALKLMPRGANGRTYFVAASSKQLMHQWIDALSSVGVAMRGRQVDNSSLAVKQGQLKKVGGKTKSWKMRWFVLRRNALFYFEARDQAHSSWKPLGSVPLKRSTVSACAPSDHGGRSNAFRVFHPQRRTYFMQAASANERDVWIAAIAEAMADVAADGPKFGVRSGWLEQQNAKGRWSRQWYVLEDNIVYHTDAPTEFRVNNTFDLDGFTMEYEPEPVDGRYPITFSHPAQGVYTAFAATADERREWLIELNASIAAAAALRNPKGHVGDVRASWEVDNAARSSRDQYDPLSGMLHASNPTASTMASSTPAASSSSAASSPSAPAPVEAARPIGAAPAPPIEAAPAPPTQAVVPPTQAPAPAPPSVPPPGDNDDDASATDSEDATDSDFFSDSDDFDFDSDDMDLNDAFDSDSDDDDVPAAASPSAARSQVPARPPRNNAASSASSGDVSQLRNRLHDQLSAALTKESAEQDGIDAVVADLEALPADDFGADTFEVSAPPPRPPRPAAAKPVRAPPKPPAKPSVAADKDEPALVMQQSPAFPGVRLRGASALRTDTIERMYDEATIKTGTLIKLGGKSNAWQKRLFVLKASYLAYFKTPDDMEPTGVINLKRCTLGNSTKRENCFAINKPGRTYWLATRTVDAKQDWMLAIQGCIDVCRAAAAAAGDDGAAAAASASAGARSRASQPIFHKRNVVEVPLDAPLARTGYLSKRGGNRKNWSTRWFTLQQGYLSYYKSSKSSRPLGVIVLKDVTVDDSGRRPFCMAIYTPTRTYFAEAKSMQEKEEWIQAVRRATE